MSISKLTDIIPVTTMIESEAILSKARPPRRKASLKHVPITPNKQTGPWPIKSDIWDLKFEKFLKYCGWKIDKQSEIEDALKHPKDKLWFCDGEFLDDDYDTLMDSMITRDEAEGWYADDVNFILYKEISLAKKNKAIWRLEIRLK